LINGQLWCLKCHHGKPPYRKPIRKQKRNGRGTLQKKRRRLLKANPKCAYCDCELKWETATLDHVVPRSKGGTNAMDNLVLACQPCNVRKADKALEESLNQPLHTDECLLVSMTDEKSFSTEMKSTTPDC